tara:strand:+ start:222 stop:827 length:606 start_codon:yes stop_codon:yes gene_type:complete
MNWHKTAFLEQYISQFNIDTSLFNYIIEIGSKDCQEALTFTKLFPNAHIVSFECNPKLLPQCRTNAAKSNNITLIEKCVTDNTDDNLFYLPKNLDGTASLHQPNFLYDTVNVDTIRMDQFLTDQTIDLLWIDVQGAESKVLNSFGSKLNQVNTIYCEVDVSPIRYQHSSYESQIIQNLTSFTLSSRLLLNPNEAHLILNKK